MTFEHWQVPYEKLPTDRLLDYINGQFLDAIQKEESEGMRGYDAENGTFIQRVSTDQGHVLLRGSRRILLKPPHPVDVPGTYCEVFAVSLDESNRSLTNKEFIEKTDFYILRDFTNGRPGPYWLLNGDGAQVASTDDAAMRHYSAETVDSNPFKPHETAEKMVDKYLRYNIVATTE
jgi:hypothetical protein